VERVEELLSADETTWARIEATLRTDFRSLDRLLLRLHYRRRTVQDDGDRDRILHFLAMGYLLTADVRYFNEFLWFDRAGNHSARGDCLRAFEENLLDGIHHVFPLATPESVQEFVQQVETRQASAPEDPQAFRVALLGAPFGFAAIARELDRVGVSPDLYYIPGSDSRRLRQWLKSSWLAPKLACWARGCFLPYRTLRQHPNDSALGTELARGGYDVALHRLSFIIRKSLIESFRLGILNDHLAVLPYVRGRSSIEFSLLFGFPVGATVHFVDEGVDTGDILRIYTYPIDGRQLPTVRGVKAAVIREGDARFLDTLRSMVRRRVMRIENPLAAGLQYFTMHAFLVEHIEKRVLPRRRG
jgi:hypothetical protein